MKKLGLDFFVEQFADSPAALVYLESNFSSMQALDQAALLDAVDESDFTLRQWVDALMLLERWLEVRELELPVVDQLGYVCCSAEAAGAGANVTYLPSLVEDMLAAYGCERAVKR